MKIDQRQQGLSASARRPLAFTPPALHSRNSTTGYENCLRCCVHGRLRDHSHWHFGLDVVKTKQSLSGFSTRPHVPLGAGVPSRLQGRFATSGAGRAPNESPASALWMLMSRMRNIAMAPVYGHASHCQLQESAPLRTRCFRDPDGDRLADGRGVEGWRCRGCGSSWFRVLILSSARVMSCWDR